MSVSVLRFAAVCSPLAALLMLPGCNSAPAEAQATAHARVGAKIIPDDPPMDQALASDPLLGHDYVRVYDAGVRIPPRFRGVWAPTPAACAGDSAPLLIVGAAELRLPEGTRIANRIEDFAADAIAIGLTRAGATPGAQEPARLHISADKNRLFLLNEKIEPIGEGWVRCPDQGE